MPEYFSKPPPIPPNKTFMLIILFSGLYNIYQINKVRK